MTQEFWSNVWQVLVEECGASEERGSGHGFDSFHHYMAESYDWYEFRFIGHLGFGGKFHRRWNGDLYVSCYPEEMTPAKRKMIDRANERLAAMAVPA
jgi:hypothetical protein